MTTPNAQNNFKIDSNAIIIDTDNVLHTIEILSDYGCRAFWQRAHDYLPDTTRLFVAGSADELTALVEAIWPRWGWETIHVKNVEF